MVKTLTHINSSSISLRQVRPHSLRCHHSLISPSSSSSSTPRMYKTLLHLQGLKRTSEQTSLLPLKCDVLFVWSSSLFLMYITFILVCYYFLYFELLFYVFGAKGCKLNLYGYRWSLFLHGLLIPDQNFTQVTC